MRTLQDMDFRRHPLMLLGASLLAAAGLGLPSGCIVGILAPEDAGTGAQDIAWKMFQAALTQVPLPTF